MEKTNKYAHLKSLCRTLYDYQAIRISIYNRIVSKEYLADVELKENKELSEKDKAVIRKNLIDKMIAWYKEHHVAVDRPIRLASRIKELEVLSKSTNGPINDFTKYNLVKDFVIMSEREDEVKKLLAYEIKDIPIYIEFLSKVKGCGPMMSAIILSNLDVHQAPHVSSFWRYCGIDTWENPETGERIGRNNHSEQLIDREYIDKNGKPATRKGTTYNPAFRTKMLGVLGDSFIKHGGKYREAYDNAKYKYTNYREGWSKLHVHRAAIRIAIREFLRDLWTTWRELEGYPPELDWNETQRQRAHGESAEAGTEVNIDNNGNLIPDDIDAELPDEVLDTLYEDEQIPVKS